MTLSRRSRWRDTSGRVLCGQKQCALPGNATCISCAVVFIDRPQRVFEVAPLVPGFPSLDVKPHSSGETRRRKIFRISGF